ncbi:hypothetical protein ElyMa_002009500 [Elysia marginata]|uniref:Uncharacterized protein n=1 Tax=Elysia marginata TaxID=1093978 RepID=A0AAV4F5A1_9GAST|nr:hypothetical protein ElyMa_002009500 [Elysia marginata]
MTPGVELYTSHSHSAIHYNRHWCLVDTRVWKPLLQLSVNIVVQKDDHKLKPSNIRDERKNVNEVEIEPAPFTGNHCAIHFHNKRTFQTEDRSPRSLTRALSLRGNP